MYAILFSSKFHPKEAASDRVRRRRWLRSMQPKSVNSDLSAVFRFENINEVGLNLINKSINNYLINFKNIEIRR